MKGIGVYPGPFVHNLDHLVPLCHLMGLPILCTDPWVRETIELYYPEIEILFEESYDLTDVLCNFDTLLYIDHFRRANGSFQFYQYYHKGPARSLCALHGNSDKKRNVFWIEKFCDEDVSLIYGNHMLDFLKEKACEKRLHKCLLGGNYRYEYYLAHEKFFDEKIKPFLFPKNERKTIFYAPTWIAPNRGNVWREDYSNFFEVAPFVFDTLPDEFQMIVKLHPNMLEHYRDEVDSIKQKYVSKENLLFIEDIPLIYPFLKIADAYLGDFSSIGYDFLKFNRPLFFLVNDERGFLKHCGTYITDFTKLYTVIKQGMEEDRFAAKREEIYSYAFGKKKMLLELREDIQEAFS